MRNLEILTGYWMHYAWPTRRTLWGPTISIYAGRTKLTGDWRTVYPLDCIQIQEPIKLVTECYSFLAIVSRRLVHKSTAWNLRQFEWRTSRDHSWSPMQWCRPCVWCYPRGMWTTRTVLDLEDTIRCPWQCSPRVCLCYPTLQFCSFWTRHLTVTWPRGQHSDIYIYIYIYISSTQMMIWFLRFWSAMISTHASFVEKIIHSTRCAE